MNGVAACLGAGVVTGEAIVRIDGRGKVIHLVAGRQGDVKRIRIQRQSFEFDRVLARIFRFQQCRGFRPDHPRAHQQHAARVLRVILGFEVVIEPEGLTELVEIEHVGLGDAEGRERVSQQSSRGA